MSPSVLVTGANGFVGRAVVDKLLACGFDVRAAVRQSGARFPADVSVFEVGSIDAATDWRSTVAGATAVVHCAAHVHQLRETAANALSEFRKVNRHATEALAKQARDAGVSRFVFLSSIKVNGETTAADRPFRADDTPRPSDPYGLSKWEAERLLRRIESESALKVVVIRPPLVYGPGVRANFRNMMDAVRRGLPLPLGAIHNRRSIVALDNLVDLVALTLRHDAAPGETFLVSDGEDLSTTDLLRRVGAALGRPARLLPVPASLIRAAARVAGRAALAQRLCDSLQVDIGPTRLRLGWQPPARVDDVLVRTAQHFLASLRE